MQNNAPGNRWSQRFSINRPFRNSSSSAHSLATINTVLPQYSVTDSSSDLPPDFDDPAASGIALASESTTSPSRQFLENVDSSSSLLPRYSTILTFPVEQDGGVDGTKDHQFEYTFPIRDNKPWCTLHLFTRDSFPGNPDISQQKPKIPRFWGGQAIAGMLAFDMQSSQTIQQVMIRLKGKIVTSSLGGSKTFLDHEVLLWSKGSASSATIASDFNGKFIGKHNFPFSFPFPTHVKVSSLVAVIPHDTISPFSLDAEWSSDKRLTSSTDKLSNRKKMAPPRSFHPSSTNRNAQAFLSEKGAVLRPINISEQKASGRDDDSANAICPTPQSFLESQSTANVQYELSIHIDHGRFRTDSKIKTNIGYVPSIIPRPASVKRQAAYESGTLIPGPAADPDGWFALPEAVIEGEMGGVGGREVNIRCKLYLANPLSYTRGTAIPCYLGLSSEDSKALSALCKPKTPYVRLVRRIQYFAPVAEENNTNGPRPNFLSDPYSLPVNATVAGNSGLRTDLHEVGIGLWWVPPKDVVQEPNLRHLEGEIHLDLDLQPSCASEIFSVEYLVEMLPLNSNIFEVRIENGKKCVRAQPQVIISHLVEVATLFSQDTPVPVAFSKPPKKRIMINMQESEDILDSYWQPHGGTS